MESFSSIQSPLKLKEKLSQQKKLTKHKPEFKKRWRFTIFSTEWICLFTWVRIATLACRWIESNRSILRNKRSTSGNRWEIGEGHFLTKLRVTNSYKSFLGTRKNFYPWNKGIHKVWNDNRRYTQEMLVKIIANCFIFLFTLPNKTILQELFCPNFVYFFIQRFVAKSQNVEGSEDR